MTVATKTETDVTVWGTGITDSSINFVVKSILNTPELQPIISGAVAHLRSKTDTRDIVSVCESLRHHLQAELERCTEIERPVYKAAKFALNSFQPGLNVSQTDDHSEEKQSNSKWTAPPPDEESKALSATLPFLKNSPLINKQTPIGAAGSCFATEITHYLRANGYNYVTTEPNENSCAAWGGLYNTPSFRQLVEVAFGLRPRPKLLFECEDTGEKEFWDPFREGVFFKSVEEYEASTDAHLVAAREALLKAKVFIMTVGLNEIWRLNYDNSVLARYPRTLASHLVHKQLLTVDENVSELQRMLEVWRAHNPELKVIITVSPVPLYATFRAEEQHVIAATCHSKSVLRIAVEKFVKQNPGIAFYFPAFEVVSYCAPQPWQEDCRHVTTDTVAHVMDLFERTFLGAKS